MRSKGMKTAVVASLLVATGVSSAQQINLTAGPTGTTLPDGNGVPMWGYTCGAVVSGSTAACAPLSGPSSPAAMGALGAVSIINGGKGYTTASVSIAAPTCTINTTTCVQATGTASVANGQVVSISLTTRGAGYTSAPAVTITGDGSGAAATAGPAWSPVVITVPVNSSGATSLQINLTNNLVFTPPGATTANQIPTSLMIVGQVGGGLGALGQRTTTASPDHSEAQANYTWPIASPNSTSGTPPKQGPRVQSFGTEVEAVAAGTAATCTASGPATGCAILTWPLLRPGTYLLESGTHPSIQVPMGLIGVLVVTSPPSSTTGTTTAGTAYPGSPAPSSTIPGIPAVQYNAEIPLEFSEIDPVQNSSVNVAVNTAGFSESATTGTYGKGGVSTVNVVSGGKGYTSAPNVTISGGGGSGAMASASIDTTKGSPTFGQVVGITVNTAGTGYTSAPTVMFDNTGTGGSGAAASALLTNGANSLAHCGQGLSPAAAACYPPAVNYTPFYFLINGVAFSKANAAASQFPVLQGATPAPTTGITGNVLVRLVNAGLRMHVPSIVGSQTTGWNGDGTATAAVGGFTLVAEDGNPVPGPLTSLPAPRVQTDVFMAAGKTFDVMITAPTSTTAAALPVYDRELSLSGNSSERDAGMLAYISVNGAGLPAFGAGVAGTPVANADTYSSVVACPSGATCTPVVVSSVAKGVMANDSFVYGVQLATGPTNGTLTCAATPGSPVAGLCSNGTFTYTPNPGATAGTGGVFDTFQYCANGTTLTSSPSYCTTVTLKTAPANTVGITVTNTSFTAQAAGYISVAPPGPLAYDKDNAGFPLSVVTSGTAAPTSTCTSLSLQPNGGFIATAPVSTTATTCTFTYTAQNNQGVTSTPATVTINFPAASNVSVTVFDGMQYKACQGDATCIGKLTPITDYRWIIEEDKTFYVNPACTTNSTTTIAGCPAITGTTVPPTFGVNFHTSHMGYVAQGCTGTSSSDQSCEEGQTLLGVPAVCQVGNGMCVTGVPAQQTPLLPSQVGLNPYPGLPACSSTLTSGCAPYPKRFYISVLPGDAANPFANGYTGNPAACVPVSGGSSTCGHGMGGAPITWNPSLNSGAGGWNPVIVLSEPSPYPPGKLSVQVFEDDFPLNGEQDAGGGVDVIATNEPGLGGFEIIMWDDMGASGDVTGQMTHDMFNQPLSNALAGTIDPATGLDACPISPEITANVMGGDGSLQGLTGRIVTCPKFESNGVTPSPLAGQAVVANLMPGRYSIQAYPGADRIARGEEWLQTNTLDGQHPHDSFIRIGEPSYFQEYGPAGFHVSIGFANPKIINARWQGVCNGTDLNLQGSNCTNTVTGRVTAERMSRPPDERLYSSGSRDAFYWTQCFVSLGDPDGEDFMFTKCDANGNFTFTGVPQGSWRLSVFDQWNDQLMDGLSTPVSVCAGTPPPAPAKCTANSVTIAMGDIPVQQWQANVYTRTFVDDNKNGLYDGGELGIPFLNTTVRYRDGSLANNLVTDFNGVANFNETFPLFNWYVVETDNTRYKTTGIHTVYDAGGPANGTTCGGSFPACESGTPYDFLANTKDPYPLPADLSVPGAIYCASAACGGQTISSGLGVPSTGVTSSSSTGRIDPPWVFAEGWQGFSGQNNFIEFGKTPYAGGENGGIRGHVIYASTRPFDDPQMLVQTQWEPLVPGVTINLYQEGFAADGVTPTLTLVDSTQTSSWDAWAQGFRSDTKPNMSCPGQAPAPTSSTSGDLFFYTLSNQSNYLNVYDSYYNGGAVQALPYNSQFKCYDAMHNWNQIQPAPYDGVYQFPSVLGIVPNSTNGRIAGTLDTSLTGGVGKGGAFTPGNMPGTNCTICIPNPDSTDPWRHNTPMLPAGKYVVEIVLPPGYELVKEEDKNILIGDNFIAPVSQQFGGLANIFILPDQASVASLYDPSAAGYNPNSAQNPTQSFAMAPRNDFVPGFLEPVWPCVGQTRIVPDYISLFPESAEVAPFAGATRNLCDRKEVTLGNQMGATAKFYIYTSTHIASKFTGVITDDFTSEFDPFAPVFGEKFSPPNMPVSVRDWAGNETARVYSDQWGAYNGLTYSTWEVNPPNPTGYAPTMMVQCMNDAGPIPGPNGTLTTDPFFNPLYSQFCYELPYMPGTTDYLDTPVVPTAGMVGAGYNNPDCAYPAETPAVAEVDGDGVGPWVSGPGHTITITALGNQNVNNYGYAGPQASTSPYNQKTVTRHYGFGTQCTAPTPGSATCNTTSTVTIGGAAASIVSWVDGTIVATVPGNVPNCAIQQQVQYGNPNTTGAPGQTTRCGELVITSGNGRQSVDTVTVTVGGKAPKHVAASQSVQAAIDAAAPGDLIIVDPTCTNAGAQTACTARSATNVHSTTTHREILLMWKPVRLQGVGAVSSIIDASTHPAGALKLDPWRASVNCLFGLALNGQPNATGNPFDPASTYSCPTPSSPTASGTGPDGNTWNYFYGGPNFPTMVVDRIPLEGILGWDATVNGNLAEQLQEPSIMGAYEGAGITVLAKGVNIPKGSTDVFGAGTEAAFPTGTTLLTGTVSASGGSLLGDNNSLCGHGAVGSSGFVPNRFPSNFQCNPSSIDGLTVTDSSQGGGGIFEHAWGHNLQIANNRIYNNAGTLSGGISMGQGESPEAYLNGTAADTDLDPGSCLTGGGLPTNLQLPFCLQLNVNVHHNMIVDNSSTGDELFTGTPAGAGGVSICTGSDYYKFNYNWVCGNLSTGDGGGLGHLGFSWNGDIEHNTFQFNQATNPSIQANGGGLIIMGAAPDKNAVFGSNGNVAECGSVTDIDCAPGLSDGTGPGLIINANLFEGNSADAGSGGGIRLQAVSGTDIARFPNPVSGLGGFRGSANCESQYTSTGALNCLWNVVSITNNIINNNVAGWDGAGISLEDALAVRIVNNTISSNDTSASSGVLLNTLGAPLASSQAPTATCKSQLIGTVSCPQPAGLVVTQNSPQLTSSFTTGQITCPAGNYAPGTAANGGTGAGGGTCINISYPALYNNIFWENRSFQIGVGGLGTGQQNQQAIVSLYNAAFDGTVGGAVASQSATGACPATSSYWDIGVRNDTGPANHGSGYTLNPLYGVLSPGATGYNASNSTGNPQVVSQYCNGSRVPPEATCQSPAGQQGVPCGWQVPPGISDAVVPNPVFSLTPAATVDEGNNWVNISWGPLSMLNPVTSTSTSNFVLGNYALASTSTDIDSIACNAGSNSITGCTEPINASGVTNILAPQTDFFGNTRPDTANPNHIDVGAVEFQGAGGSAPSLTSISPTSGVRGQTLTVTLVGSNLTGATAVNVSGTGIAVSNITVVSAAEVTATFTIATTAATGARTVSVTTPGGTTNTETFTVNSSGTLSYTAATNGTLATFLGVRTLSFTIPTARTPVTSVVTITNTGTGPLYISAETIAQIGTPFFSVTGTTCSFTTPLAPTTGTCTVSVTYATPATRPGLPHVAALTVANGGTNAGMLVLSAQ